MGFKHVLVFCAQAFLIQLVISQSIRGAHVGPGLGYDSLGLGSGCGSASTGGGFAVHSASPFAPTGVSVVSENAIEGSLAVGGSLPLLGSVGVEGAFPTGGAGAVSYGCGDGSIGIATEGPIATGILNPGLSGSGLTGLGLSGPGLAGPGLAYGGYKGLAGPCGI